MVGRQEYVLIADRVWTIVSFFAIVLQLIIIRGFAQGALYLFVLPPLVALLLSIRGATPRVRFLSKMFLTMIALGLFISASPRICPDLGGVDAALPPAQDAALAWYGIVYVAFLTCVCPIHVFLSELKKHREHDSPQISKATCRLGLVAAVFISPLLLTTMMNVLKFWPVYR